jgi:hypothetical protein
MKNLIILILSIFTLSFFASCCKEPTIPPSIVNGQVVEFGTAKPIENVMVVLMEGTYGGFSSGTYSFYPIDTFLTDANGRYSYEHKIPSSRKIYELWYFKSTYFDISNVGENDKVTSVEENKTKSVVTKMSPFAWLKIRVVNDKPFDDGDYMSIEVTDQDRKFYGDKVNQTFIEKVNGNAKQKFSWIIQRNLKWGQVFIDSVYCKGHDTTYYQLRY